MQDLHAEGDDIVEIRLLSAAAAAPAAQKGSFYRFRGESYPDDDELLKTLKTSVRGLIRDGLEVGTMDKRVNYAGHCNIC